MIHRRQFTGALLLPLAAASFDIRAESRPGLARQLAEIEKKTGGRLGVHVLDTADGRRAGHRQDERFALCSTFMFLAAALVLARVDQGKERLDRRVVYSRDDLVTYSPATEKHAGTDGMTMAQLCVTAASRAQLLQWLDDNKTGGQRIRAGLPAGWKVGDKTGTGENGATNDIAILRPPGRAPVLLSVYLTETQASMADRNAAHAAVAAAVAAWITGA